MGVQAIELSQTRASRNPQSLTACAGAAAFVIAAAWYGLAANGVTQSPAPAIRPGTGTQQGLRIFYRWFVTTLPQERLYTVIAIAAFACLAAVACFLRDELPDDRSLARTGGLAVAAGAGLWIAGPIAARRLQGGSFGERCLGGSY